MSESGQDRLKSLSASATTIARQVGECAPFRLYAAELELGQSMGALQYRFRELSGHG